MWDLFGNGNLCGYVSHLVTIAEMDVKYRISARSTIKLLYIGRIYNPRLIRSVKDWIFKRPNKRIELGNV